MKYVFWLAIVVAVCLAGWEIIAPAVTNLVFQDELHDAAAQLGWHSGLPGPNSDEEFRNIVVRKAEKHNIVLDPKQVTVRRATEMSPVVFIAVDYTVKVDLLVYSFPLHFNPTSKGDGPFWRTVSEPVRPPVPTNTLPKSDQHTPNQPGDQQRKPALKEIPPSLRRPQ